MNAQDLCPSQHHRATHGQRFGQYIQEVKPEPVKGDVSTAARQVGDHMQGFQAENVDVIRCERVVCVVKVGNSRAKAFQVFFGADGSLFISFPYFRHRTGILSSSALPANRANRKLT